MPNSKSTPALTQELSKDAAKENEQLSIIIANDLLSGRSVYLTRDSGWSNSVQDAELIRAELSASRLERAGDDEKKNLVLDPNLIAVNPDRTAVEIRERIRISGPTILDDAAEISSATQAA